MNNIYSQGNFIYTNITEIGVLDHSSSGQKVKKSVAVNSLLDGGSEITLCTDAMANHCNLEILWI